MSDPRLTPNPALATQSDPARIIHPVTDLRRRPGGPRDRQLIYGDGVTVLHIADGWAYVQAQKDGYCGHVIETAMGQALPPTHWVSAPATHAYSVADLKSTENGTLSFGARVTVTAQDNGFAQTEMGHVPLQHLSVMGQALHDPAAVALLFLGTPYLWGGNSRAGIDCSGLVQAALLACGHPCPGDSDMQMSLGRAAQTPYQRNDLLFWKGHVALVTDPQTMIHANAHAMACTLEPIDIAIDRIKAGGDGPLTAHRRLVV